MPSRPQNLKAVRGRGLTLEFVDNTTARELISVFVNSLPSWSRHRVDLDG